MHSEIDVEIVKIRGIIYQQNLGMEFESGVAVSHIGVTICKSPSILLAKRPLWYTCF
jgi:hypothetical protein